MTGHSGQTTQPQPRRLALLPPHTAQQPCIACEQLLKEAYGLTDVAQAELLSLYV